MAIQITIDSIVSGTSPYNVWVTDSCSNAGVSQYINSFSTSAFTFTLPTMFETYPIYYVKIIDANNCEYCVSPPIENCNIFVGYWDGYDYYKYNLASDTEEGPLSFSVSPVESNSLMANTDDKIWFLTVTGVSEYDVTITPFTESYNREVFINLSSLKSAFAINNNNLLVCATNTATTKTYVHNAIITGTTAVTTSLLEVVGGLSGNTGIKDMKLSTEDKLIILGLSGSTHYLQQYDYVASGALETQIVLSGITNPGSFVEVNNNIYILTNNNEIYQVGLTSPYLITFIQTSTTPIGFGKSSQKYGCITQKFT